MNASMMKEHDTLLAFCFLYNLSNAIYESLRIAVFSGHEIEIVELSEGKDLIICYEILKNKRVSIYAMYHVEPIYVETE